MKSVNQAFTNQVTDHESHVFWLYFVELQNVFVDNCCFCCYRQDRSPYMAMFVPIIYMSHCSPSSEINLVLCLITSS